MNNEREKALILLGILLIFFAFIGGLMVGLIFASMGV